MEDAPAPQPPRPPGCSLEFQRCLAPQRHARSSYRRSAPSGRRAVRGGARLRVLDDRISRESVHGTAAHGSLLRVISGLGGCGSADRWIWFTQELCRCKS